MVTVEKAQELGAVVNFWKAEIASLDGQLSMLQDMKAHNRHEGDRYAADRLLREIKRKAAEVAEAERSLRAAERDLLAITGQLGVLARETALPPPAHRSAH